MRLDVFPQKFLRMFKMMRSRLGFLLLQCVNMTDKMIGGAVLNNHKGSGGRHARIGERATDHSVAKGAARFHLVS
jgi:hypothetical protein